MPPDAVRRVGCIVSSSNAGLAARIAGLANVSIEMCDILLAHFDDEETARSMMWGPDGVVSKPRAGLVVVELSPVSPAFMVELAARCEAAACRAYGGALQGHQAYVDSALLDDPDVAALIQRIAPGIRPTGATGTSKAMAIVERLLACVNATAAVEAIALGARAGIPEQVLVPLLLKGSGGNHALGRLDRLGSCQRDLALAVGLGRQLGHSARFGAMALAACGR